MSTVKQTERNSTIHLQMQPGTHIDGNTKRPSNTCIVLSVMLLVIALFTRCAEPPTDTPSTEEGEDMIEYDSALAEKLGADAYGMKPYVMAFLKAGPNRDLDSTEAAKLQRAHLDNIFRMADEGKLVVAGPFMDTGSVRGIYIFNVSSLEEAEALTATDPAIKAGSLVMELRPWYGSAALGMINDLHKKVSKTKI